MSPTITSSCGCRTVNAFALRTNAVTRWPRSNACVTMQLPVRPVAPNTVSCISRSRPSLRRVAQHQIDNRRDDQHEQRREDDPRDDEMQRLAAREVAFAIGAALHAECGRRGAAGDLPERQRLIAARIFGGCIAHASALAVGSF